MRDTTRRKRAGGRSAKRAARQQSPVATVAFIDRKIPYYELLDEAALESERPDTECVL